MYAAADHLGQSERGREALAGLNQFFERGYSLDSGNIGAWTGSARDAVAEHLEAERSK
jgi:hypothetical protein